MNVKNRYSMRFSMVNGDEFTHTFTTDRKTMSRLLDRAFAGKRISMSSGNEHWIVDCGSALQVHTTELAEEISD